MAEIHSKLFNLLDSNSFEDLKDLTFNQNFLGMAQINPIAGNLEFNYNKILKYIEIANKLGLSALVFPKYSLLGDKLTDFVNRYPFIIEENKKYLNKLANYTQNTAVLIDFIDNDKIFKTAILRNRHIENILEQDLISSKYINDGVEYLIKQVAIPSRTNTEELRQNTLIKLTKDKKRPIAEINRVGAIDNNSYGGASCVYDENGNLISRAKSFEEQLLIVNPVEKIGKIYETIPQNPPKEFTLDYEWDLERTYKTIVQGIRDYFNKCGIKRAVLGLSGGLDSTVCAVLLVDALGKENVFGVSMPSKLTSNESKSDALELAKNLGIGFTEVSIKPMFDTCNECFNTLFSEVENNWDGRFTQSFTPDNIQARSRAMYLWGIANEFSSCVPIATSDKSEAYMGYATINGDMSGGFAPIVDITKTKLFALARWMNKNREIKNVIPESVLLKRPGAELAIDPNTGKTLCAEDALMPYEFLDEIIWRIENAKQSYQDLLKTEFIYEKKNNISKEQKIEWLDKFYRRMSSALYKGYIMPPSVIVETETINKTAYSQPITSGKINYKV